MKADSCLSDSSDESLFEIVGYVTVVVQTEEYTTTDSKKGVKSMLVAFPSSVGMDLNKDTRAFIKNIVSCSENVVEHTSCFTKLSS